jgi:hypothetical protein
MAMSRLLGELDRVLGTVQRGKAGIMLSAWRHDAIALNRPVALLVVTEQARRKVIAPAVALAGLMVDLHLHSDIPFAIAHWSPRLRGDIDHTSGFIPTPGEDIRGLRFIRR